MSYFKYLTQRYISFYRQSTYLLLKTSKRDIMKASKFSFSLIFLIASLVFSSCESKVQSKQLAKTSTNATDPLPSWNEGPTKKAILDFVDRTTKEGSPDFIPVEERIACFDNDGTLWAEQPLYFQLAFVLDRVKTLAPQHPEWKTKE